MFTGIIERTGRIVEVLSKPKGKSLRIDIGPLSQDLKIGASIAVSGVCLTVTQTQDSLASFDVISETLQCSTLGSKKIGGRVNLERSLRVGDRLDGHFVQGHIDGTCMVDRIESGADEWTIWLQTPPELTRFMIAKGSVTLDGVSLTIAASQTDRFSVALIPTTLDATTLGDLKQGDRVNVETDIIARTIVHQLKSSTPTTGLSMDCLKQAGYA